MNQERRRQLLEQCYLFTTLGPNELGQLAAAASVRRYHRGQVVLTEGDTSDVLLLVVEGELKVIATSDHGEELILAILRPGDTIGELGLVDGGPRSATVIAVTVAMLLRMPNSEVLAVANCSPTLMTALVASLAGIVRRLTGTAADLVFLDLSARVAKLLLTEADATGRSSIELGLTQSELAQAVGASRQSLNSTLQTFVRRGWILNSRGKITIVNTAALRRLIEH